MAQRNHVKSDDTDVPFNGTTLPWYRVAVPRLPIRAIAPFLFDEELPLSGKVTNRLKFFAATGSRWSLSLSRW
ncbi:MAG: hypothetical protein SVX43_12320 [Cyanobacteriota bacterium]|nr:hypothetical protein [Cyanobacteriota bacterium]